MASLRAALFFSFALALVLSSQARPLDEASPLGQLSAARHLLANSTACCILYKKTEGDLANFASQTRSLASQQSNLITSLLTQPALKQQLFDLLGQADKTLTDDGSQLYGTQCLTQVQAGKFGTNLLLVRNIAKGVQSLNAINGLTINLNILGIPVVTFGAYLVQALNTFASQSDAISADLLATAKALSGCSA